MKKTILLLAVIMAMSLTMNAQGKFEEKDFGTFKLHCYITNDPMGDMSYIIEGYKGLIVLEPAAFFDNIKEFGQYVAQLNKPVEKIIANYHAAGFSAFDHSKFVMIEGMSQFIQGDIYKGMMNSFTGVFGDAIDASDYVPSATVPNNANEKWVGVDFQFSPGASSDFPASSILIGKQVYYMHFTPVANIHMSPLQIVNRQAIDATIAELEYAKASGATTFIGGHGAGIANLDDLNYQIEYLKTMKEAAEQIKTGDEFLLVMQMTYPNAAAKDNLSKVAANIYKK